MFVKDWMSQLLEEVVAEDAPALAADELLDVVLDEPVSSKTLTESWAFGPAFHKASDVSIKAVST